MRTEIHTFLQQEIKYLPGVGPRRAELLHKELEIACYRDLLYHFPYKYLDRTRFYTVREIRPDLPAIQVRGRITSMTRVGAAPRERLVMSLSDDTGTVPLVFFKGIKYIAASVRPDTEYVIFGKPTLFNGSLNLVHPEIEPLARQEEGFSVGLQPQYPSTEKLRSHYLTSRVLHKLMATLWAGLPGQIPETLPEGMRSRLGLPSLHQALFDIHFPQTPELLRKAEYRLKFEELFYLQMNVLSSKMYRKNTVPGFRFEHIGQLFNDFYENHLPFRMTEAQKRVIREIRRDLGLGRQMNRLLQGDVGSGKTLVALSAMLIAIGNGFQACMMAPTEILSRQHLDSVSRLLEGLPVRIALLTGSTSRAERKQIAEGLMEGSIHLLIGTHALIEETVQFRNLGLVVIDEQHRFGVAQRAALWQKNECPPHILVMTATPIPRTLAMTVYGDLDVSVLDELPPGRKPVMTYHYYDMARRKVFRFLREQLALKRQVYVVYPMISESEKSDYENLERGFAIIREAFPESEYTVGMVHGKMKNEDKDLMMRLFKSGDLQILVATTVIEVGVDVPNASVMVIESAERFGLSQLHQLRGRVGRGAEQSYCVLMTSVKLSQDARKRIEVMVETNDGFRISEVDLDLRGQGDIEGTQQSGKGLRLQIADLARDGQLLQFARNQAEEILEADPLLNKPENHILKEECARRKTTPINWGRIG